jgi:invasion protein IalB
MTVDVANLELNVLKCWFYLMQSRRVKLSLYRVECDLDYYINQSNKAYKYYSWTKYCNDNLTEDQYCEIEQYINWIKKQEIYLNRECNTLETSCGTTITDMTPTLECGVVSINILQ